MKVFLFKTHNQGLRHLLITVSWDMEKLEDMDISSSLPLPGTSVTGLAEAQPCTNVVPEAMYKAEGP